MIEGRKEKLEEWAQQMEATTTGPAAEESDIVAYDALSVTFHIVIFFLVHFSFMFSPL